MPHLDRRWAIAGGAAAVVIALIVTLVLVSGGSEKKPTAAPSASPSPSASPTKAKPPKTCPLTGLEPAKGQNPDRPALAVKIDNVDVARPQAGITQADVVVEELVEGGLTRLFAIFQCDSADNVGPIRSARPVDGDLLRLLNGSVFGYSGAAARSIAPVRERSRAVLISNDDLPQYFTRVGSRAAPHNVFSSTHRLVQAGLERNKKLKAPRPLFVYGKNARSGTKVKTASVSWPFASATWTWSGGAWQRSQNGTPDVVTSGKRVSAANVVVMSIAVRDSGIRDVMGNATPDDVITGRGTVWVLRDGHVFRGKWIRPQVADPMRLTDGRGHILRLKPGQTWIELLPRPRTPQFG